ncbi:hypothetical protein DSO57_1013705 [Entomophthora muscae]|uniref:Uncharacterized protein n=2 Tax=Entomophthora muscae TaxID=34485 RepID=A0ACC2RZ86_9FUNG|nr:hypothetical protein DSO57_1004567 [Entomophthora muscae]KAJ9073675.1 hypothetical protein DSO57_1013705 [Entomophthora muscae]
MLWNVWVFLFASRVAATESALIQDYLYLQDIVGHVSDTLVAISQLVDENIRHFPNGGAIVQAMHVAQYMPARRLPKPRLFPHVSAQNLRNNLQNSLLALCPEEVAVDHMCICQERYSQLQVFQNKTEESLAMIAVDKAARQIIVTYRPTRTLKNQITNFDYELVQYPSAPKGVLIHHGFMAFHLSIHPQVEKGVAEFLKDPRFRTFDIQVTGYSLGAGISIASVPSWHRFLHRTGFTNRLIIYSYAGPRVGNDAFAEYLAGLNVPITRYTNREDIISHVPIRSLGYVHVGAEFHDRSIGPNQTELILCNPNYDEDPNCGLNPHAIFSTARHYFPFNKYLPLPPYC